MQFFGFMSPFTLFFSIVYFQIIAETNSERLTREGQVFFEAGEFGRARSAYEIALDAELSSWERATLIYDIGTVELARGNWEKALNEFGRIAIADDLSPLLIQRIKTNRALAELMLAKMKATEYRIKEQVNENDYGQILFLYQQVLIDLEDANKAVCELYEIEGEKECQNSQELEDIKLEAKKSLAEFITDHFEKRIQNLTLEQGSATLIGALQAILDNLDFLMDPTLNSLLMHKYLSLYIEEADSWLPVWTSLKKTFLDSHAEVLSEKEALFKQAHKDFVSGIDLMQKKRFRESWEEIRKSQKGLDRLLQLLFNQNPLKKSLQELLISYQKILTESPIQQVSLDTVLRIQKQLGVLLRKMENESIQINFQNSLKALDSATQALEDSLQVQARIWIEVAKEKITQLLNVLEIEKETAVTTLEEIISFEQFALRIVRLVQQVQTEVFPDVKKLPYNIQSQVIDRANRFFEIAREDQKKAFEFYSETSCQCQPWDEVIPLFFQGREKANAALEDLKSENLKLAGGSLQDALTKWKLALEKLRNYFPKSSNTFAKKSEQLQVGSKEKLLEPKEDKEKSLKQILRYIQEMEKDDHSHPVIKTVPIKPGVDRPW